MLIMHMNSWKKVKSITKPNSDRFDFRNTTLAGAYTARVHPFFGSTHPVTRTKCVLPFTSQLQKAFGNLNLDAGHGYVFPDISVHSKATCNKETHANPRRTPAIIVSFVP